MFQEQGWYDIEAHDLLSRYPVYEARYYNPFVRAVVRGYSQVHYSLHIFTVVNACLAAEFFLCGQMWSLFYLINSMMSCVSSELYEQHSLAHI